MTVTVDRLKFNTSQPQVYRDSWRNEDRICRFQGSCCLCGRRTYAFDDGQNDPRGELGDHASFAFEPEDYGCTGEIVPCCFLCQNNTEEQYNAALRRARNRGRWQPKGGA